MDTTLAIIAIVCGFIGLLGVIIPVLPGTILSFAGMLCVYYTDVSTITVDQLWIWGAISVVVIGLDYFLPGYFSKMFGGSKAGITGANIGVFVGLFLGLPGIILGPAIGAVIGELTNDSEDFGRAIKVGFGSLLSFLVGSGVKLVAGGFMMYYIVVDTIEVVKDLF